MKTWNTFRLGAGDRDGVDRLEPSEEIVAERAEGEEAARPADVEAFVAVLLADKSFHHSLLAIDLPDSQPLLSTPILSSVSLLLASGNLPRTKADHARSRRLQRGVVGGAAPPPKTSQQDARRAQQDLEHATSADP